MTQFIQTMLAPPANTAGDKSGLLATRAKAEEKAVFTLPRDDGAGATPATAEARQSVLSGGVASGRDKAASLFMSARAALAGADGAAGDQALPSDMRQALGAGATVLSTEDVKGILAEMGLPTDLAQQIEMVAIPAQTPGGTQKLGILLPPEMAKGLGVQDFQLLPLAKTPGEQPLAALTSGRGGAETAPEALIERIERTLEERVKAKLREDAENSESLFGLAALSDEADSAPRLNLFSAPGGGQGSPAALSGFAAAFGGGAEQASAAGGLTGTVSPPLTGDAASGLLLSGTQTEALRAGLDGLKLASGDTEAMKRLLSEAPTPQTGQKAATDVVAADAAQKLRDAVADAMTGGHRPVQRTQPPVTPDGQPQQSITGAPQGATVQADGASAITGMASGSGQNGAGLANFMNRPGGHQSQSQRQAPAPRQMAFQVNKAVAEGQTRFTVQLHPAELGRVAVRLDFEGGRVRAQVSAERKETLDLLERDSKVLEKALQDAGLETDGESLEFSLSDDTSNAFETALARREASSSGLAQPRAEGPGALQGNDETVVIDAASFIDPAVTNGIDIQV